MSRETSEIIDFFTDQTIFLTGATGLLGQLIIEKLIRTCPDLKRIYILIRSKQKDTAQSRFEQLLKSSCFSLLKEEDLRKKLFVLNGNCEKAILGLTLEEQQMLKKETTCVLHVAANVGFNQSLKDAGLHVRALRDLLGLAQEMEKLKVFVYMSTAYSNCVYPYITEKFVEPDLKAETFLDLVKALDIISLKKIASTILGRWPDPYFFSKFLSEDLIKRTNLKIPTAVIRPSIVCSTIEEPMKGWVDNPSALVGTAFNAQLGILSGLLGKKQARLHLVPADYVCNCTLAAAWKQSKAGTMTIYNCVGDSIPCEEALSFIDEHYQKFASEKYQWYKTYKFRESKFWHELYMWVHLIRNYFIDMVLSLLGQSTGVVKKYQRLKEAMDVGSYFISREWTFDTNNVVDLWNGMSDTDREIFPFNHKISDWKQYFYDLALGIRVYILRDPIETIPKGQRKLKMLFVAHCFVVGLFYSFLLLFVFLMLKFVFCWTGL